MADLLIKNIGELATPLGKEPLRGAEQGNVIVRQNCCIAITDGIIEFVGALEDAPAAQETIDAEGRLVTPGLVDAHTHLVFGGWRQKEFPKKLAGVPYLEILKEGGGILSTVRSTHQASEEELLEKTSNLLDLMLAHGTTTVEAKSGYGLTLEQELKQLTVVEQLQSSHVVDLVSTFISFPSLKSTAL